MGPNEVDGSWAIEGDAVRIDRTKRAARGRSVPRIADPLPRGLGWQQYGAALRPFGWQPYDARRAFVHLREERGVPRTRRRM